MPNYMRDRRFAFFIVFFIALLIFNQGCTGQKVYVTPQTFVLSKDQDCALMEPSDVNYIQTLVDKGQVPSPSSVTVEAFLKEHPVYDSCSNPICLHSDLAITKPFGSPTNVAWIRVIWNSNFKNPDRRPYNLVVAIDKTESMGKGGKIDALKKALYQLVDSLRQDDQLCIILVDSKNTILSPASSVTDTPPQSLKNRINSIETSGALGVIHIEDGLQFARSQFSDFKTNPRALKQILFFTDQRPYMGVTDPYSFLELAKRYSSEEQIGLTYFGVGVDFGPQLAASLSLISGGEYICLPTSEKIAKVFEQGLDRVVSPVASDFSLRISPATPFEIMDVLGYTSQGIMTEKEGISIQCKSFFQFGEKSLLVRLKSSASQSPFSNKEFLLARLSMSYTPLSGSGAKVEDQREVKYSGMPLSSNTNILYYENLGIRKTVVIGEIALQLKEACKLYYKSEFQSADNILSQLEPFVIREMQILGREGDDLVKELNIIRKIRQIVKPRL